MRVAGGNYCKFGIFVAAALLASCGGGSVTSKSAITPAPSPNPNSSNGIIDSSRSVDWSKPGIPGGIPARTTICATLNPGASSAQINSAIASCPGGQVVFLSAGTYTLSGGISFNGHSNVTLRGAGPTQTILNFTGGDSCGGQGGDICAINTNSYWAGSSQVQPGGSNAASWTAGYAQGTTALTLSNVPAGIAAGSTIILDQSNDTADTGGVFICDTSACHQAGESASLNGRTISGIHYNQTQVVSVTAVNGNQITISPGLYANNWRASQNPGMWWTGMQITQVGIEDLTADHTNSGGGVASGIYLYDCYECWVKNVRSITGHRNHIWIYQSARAVVRDSYFFGTLDAASESYGVESFIASDNLIENNIFDQVASPLMSAGSSGNVYGYNFSINNLYSKSPSWMQNSYANHSTGNMFNLFEGNTLNALDCDDIHGTGSLTTYFRNRLVGSQTGKTSNTHASNLYAFCRGYNIVGNVLGTTGYNTVYETSPSAGSAGACDSSVYVLGFGSEECSGGTPGNDALVRSTLLRWGNWDSANNSAQWNASEMPTTSVPFINGNSVPADHTLRNSFYLSAQPAFWNTSFGTPAWPPIGPDVTGGNDAAGHAASIPAQLCYLNGTLTNGILNFDANNCY